MHNPPIRKATKAVVSIGLAVGLSVGSVGVASASGRHGSDRHSTVVTDETVIADITEVALAEVPDATIVTITSKDRGIKAFEVKLVDADGNKVEMYLDAEYNVLQVKTKGDRGRHDDDTVTDEAIIAAASEAALAAVPGGTVIKVEAEDDDGAAYEVKMTDADGNKVEVYLDAEYNVLQVKTKGDHGDDDDDVVTDEAIIAAASEAALAAVPGGTVIEVEAEDDDGAAYEVKMTDADGNKVKVYLDAEYNVVKVKTFSKSDHGRKRGHRR